MASVLAVSDLPDMSIVTYRYYWCRRPWTASISRRRCDRRFAMLSGQTLGRFERTKRPGPFEMEPPLQTGMPDVQSNE